MAEKVISPTGRALTRSVTSITTPTHDKTKKVVSIGQRKTTRLAENRELLEDMNVGAFLKAIADAEGGGYDFKYGAVKGKRNDPWRFTDFSTHPGPGIGGRTTAAGMYQENIETWREMGGNMGLSDFTPETQDLIAVEILRVIRVIDKIKAGDISGALHKAASRWSALPQGKGLPGRYPTQPSVSYETFELNYKKFGGIVP